MKHAKRFLPLFVGVLLSVGPARPFSVVSANGVSIAGEPARRVRVGYCASLSDIDAVKSAGFDYIELRTSEVAALSDADYEELAARLERMQLPVPVTYQFMPPGIKITGPQANRERQMNYVR